MENIKMHVFKHPKYYKELRKRNNGHGRANLNGPRVAGARSLPASDQAISDTSSTEASERASDPGLKPQATRTQLETNCSFDKNPNPQASGGKLQAPSCKHQAPSRKRQAP